MDSKAFFTTKTEHPESNDEPDPENRRRFRRRKWSENDEEEEEEDDEPRLGFLGLMWRRRFWKRILGREGFSEEARREFEWAWYDGGGVSGGGMWWSPAEAWWCLGVPGIVSQVKGTELGSSP
ncbi:concanavalin A-like lectin protein kinase family protein [Striga asiatica]|uniref:Concanavalin A-like lectin protein kinase family protein n=1 Tax=Striga asiatica TaxID=4170 RepID=A0A5A7RE83_STRAF|nr:concanavalin A-like lectin protein kinase family protein [Striga asiatica]